MERRLEESQLSYATILGSIAEAVTQLKAKAQQLRAVIDTAVNGVLMLDAVGTILIYNRACKQLFGYASDEIVGRNIAMIMPAALQALPAGAQRGDHSSHPPPMVGPPGR